RASGLGPRASEERDDARSRARHRGRRGVRRGDRRRLSRHARLGGRGRRGDPARRRARRGDPSSRRRRPTDARRQGSARRPPARVARRRSTGPDLSRALCGSEGTIGFITSVVLRIHARPESRLVAAYVLPSLDAAVSAIYLSLREEAAPSGLRIYDAAEAARHFDNLALPPGHALLCAGTAGPTDLAACDRDLITSA